MTLATGLAGMASASARQTTMTKIGDHRVVRVFDFTGHTQHFFVPPGVHDLAITAIGAAGQETMTGPAGRGAVVVNTVRVFPRSALSVDVGGTALGR